jgi:hypothetical protein
MRFSAPGGWTLPLSPDGSRFGGDFPRNDKTVASKRSIHPFFHPRRQRPRGMPRGQSPEHPGGMPACSRGLRSAAKIPPIPAPKHRPWKGRSTPLLKRTPQIGNRKSPPTNPPQRACLLSANTPFQGCYQLDRSRSCDPEPSSFSSLAPAAILKKETTSNSQISIPKSQMGRQSRPYHPPVFLTCQSLFFSCVGSSPPFVTTFPSRYHTIVLPVFVLCSTRSAFPSPS